METIALFSILINADNQFDCSYCAYFKVRAIIISEINFELVEVKNEVLTKLMPSEEKL